jgi:hypothetical protein
MRPGRENLSTVFVTALKVEAFFKGMIICTTFTNPCGSPLLRRQESPRLQLRQGAGA